MPASEATDKLLEQWYQTRLAHEAMMLQDAQKLLEQNRAMTQAHNENTMGRPLPKTDDDMGIHIGDQIVNNLPPAAVATTAAAVAKSGFSKLAMGAVLASGLGLGALIPLGIGLLQTAGQTASAPAPAVQPAAKAQEWEIKFWFDGKEWKKEMKKLP